MVEYFKEALKGQGELHASNSIYTYTLSKADKWFITPPIYDDSYIDTLLDYCKENKIDAIISLFDIDLPVLSYNATRFSERGTKVVISHPHVIEICNDKWKTYNFLIDNGFLTPTTYLTPESAILGIESGEISFPLVIKPRWGMGSIGIYKAEDAEELAVLYKKLKREIFNTYLRYESDHDAEHCVIIQEMIDGDEYGLDVLNDLKGEYVTTIAKKKIAMRAGETDIAQIVSAEKFESIGKKLSTSLGHIANLDVDCFVAGNKIFILELNCRFGGQYPFTHLAGADFPSLIVEWLNGKPTKKEFISPEIGTLSCKDLNPVIVSHT